jgi:hypothetical protein
MLHSLSQDLQEIERFHLAHHAFVIPQGQWYLVDIVIFHLVFFLCSSAIL